jgi:hypothetical protein
MTSVSFTSVMRGAAKHNLRVTLALLMATAALSWGPSSVPSKIASFCREGVA